MRIYLPDASSNQVLHHSTRRHVAPLYTWKTTSTFIQSLVPRQKKKSCQQWPIYTSDTLKSFNLKANVNRCSDMRTHKNMQSYTFPSLTKSLIDKCTDVCLLDVCKSTETNYMYLRQVAQWNIHPPLSIEAIHIATLLSFVAFLFLLHAYLPAPS